MADLDTRQPLPADLQTKAAKAANVTSRSSIEIQNDYPTLPPATFNVVLFMMDDTGRSQMPQYDDLNRWPGEYPYPRMPFLTSKVAEGVRYTQARVNARCAPTRAAILTGRQCHLSAEHPDGTGIGDVVGQQYDGYTPYYEGIDSSQNPWPQVVKTATRKLPHRAGLIGKYHLFDLAEGASEPFSRNTPRDPVDAAGFHESHEILRTNLSGDPGEPNYGFYSYPYTFTTETTQEQFTAGVDLPEGNVFSPVLAFKKLTYYIKQCVDEGRPFIVDWEHNLPHGLWPNFPSEQTLEHPFGTVDVELYTSYTQDELVNDAIDATGKTSEGGFDANGNPQVGGEYGPEGEVHVPFRRTRVMLEATDKMAEMVDWFIRTYYPDAYAETIFMHYSDNGADSSSMQPQTTEEFAALGDEYKEVIPPTSDGTSTGTPYHDPEDAKGSVKDEGILTPLIVWGDIPDELKGTDCDRYIDATDFYPTILDLVQPDWADALGATEAAKVDGVSFKDTFRDPNAAQDSKEYTHHCVFRPAYHDDTTDEVFQYEKCVIGTTQGTDSEGYKLVRTYEKTYPSGPITLSKNFYLYDLRIDPAELTDLRPVAGSEGATTERGRALTELSAHYIAFYGLTQ